NAFAVLVERSDRLDSLQIDITEAGILIDFTAAGLACDGTIQLRFAAQTDASYTGGLDAVFGVSGNAGFLLEGATCRSADHEDQIDFTSSELSAPIEAVSRALNRFIERQDSNWEFINAWPVADTINIIVRTE
ncbi:MAG: hypothetical protein KC496_02025, partial [Anaerolineae bacterium]|nr:hypothetical protein [Anaerolineae bacterium]